MAAPGYPILLHLENRHVLVVGAGAVGLRKAAALLHAGARVTLVSLAFPDDVPPPCERIAAPYAPDHLRLHPFALVFAATGDPDVNRRIHADAAARGIWCSRADDRAASDFSSPAVAHAGGITIAVSTASGSPTIAAQVRDRLAAALDPAWQSLAEILPAWRQRVHAEIADPAARRTLLHRLASEEMLAVLRAGGSPAAAESFHRWLRDARPSPPPAAPVGGESACS